MREQHLSDEAVAAFADGVLTGHARERARRHTAECTECGHAVSAQREAVWLLRAAPAPSLPIGLFDRLVQVPATTPLRQVPTAIADDGSAMFAAFGTMTAAALVAAPAEPASRTRHLRPFVFTTAAVAAASVLTVASASSASGSRPTPAQSRPSTSTTTNAPVDVEDGFLQRARQPARAH